MASFTWHPGEPPPPIEDHSKAKLEVIRRYIRAYFDRLNVVPRREEFKLDLVDGFCGGGIFSDGNDLVGGSPLVMLEESKAAEERLNRSRSKPLRVDCKHYFVDKEPAHIDYLRAVLAERDYNTNDEDIVLDAKPFEGAVEGILSEIHRRQPRAGRAIFFLDQLGFSQVELQLVARILRELPAAEVILTFAADSLINHLSLTDQIIKPLARLELSNAEIEQLIANRASRGGRALVQRTLRQHILDKTGATYDTPFFIRPEQSRRSLWFLHLSRHPTARDVMIRQHWEASNTFEHDGYGGLNMMGWDPLREPLPSLPLFSFKDLDRKTMLDDLLNTLPNELFAHASDAPVSVETVHRQLANRTAASFADLDEIILRLRQEGEVRILRPDGKARSRSLKRLRPTDRIAFPDTLLLPVISRRR